MYYKSIGEQKYESDYIELPSIESKDCLACIYDLLEQTTVTKMERRVFDLNIKKLINYCRIIHHLVYI